MEAISVSSLISNVSVVVTSAVDAMASNPVTATYLGLGLVAAGAIIFAKLKRSAR